MFAWFQFSQPRRQPHHCGDQEQHSRALVAQTVRQAAEQLGVPPERVVVGGFSQGGIMALSLLLTQPALLRAACAGTAACCPRCCRCRCRPRNWQAARCG
jgi:phospholipase/carboxylesterase